MAGTFIEQLRKRQEAAQESKPEQASSKPTETMTDDELEGALNQARRDLLDAQHQELREREIARVSGDGEATGRPTGLAGILGSLQRGKRRTWR